MRVYAGMDPRLPLPDVGAYARRVEALGFDGLHVAETVHDSTVVSALALDATERIQVRTAVTVAFARSPMVLAAAAWGLAASYGGRFQLGLGTQVRANLEGRFSVPWTEPVSRMREYVGTLRAMFEAFRTGGPLRYEGEHYRLTRLQPYFNPGPHPHPDPPVYLGAVNARMSELAGEVADGVVTHPTSSHPRFLREVTAPAIRAGLERAGRVPEQVEIVVSPAVITGRTPDALAAAREHQRAMLAFVYSTPAYRRALELAGVGGVGERLHELARAERWPDLPALMTDEALDALVPAGTYAELPAVLGEWFGGAASGLVLHPPPDPDDDAAFGEVVAAVRTL